MSEPVFSARNSRWRLVLLMLLAAGFVVLGVWIAGLFGHPPERGFEWFGWLGAAFFGCCGAIAFRRMVDAGEEVRISAAGMRCRQWSDTAIPWAAIADVTVWQFQRQRSIILHLHHPERFPSTTVFGRLAGLNRALTGGDIAITLTGTDGRFAEAMAVIDHYRSGPEFTQR